MPIDPSIPLGVKPIQIPLTDPMEQYSKGLQLKALLGQQRAQDQALQDEAAQREAFAQSGGDPQAYLKALSLGNNPKAYQAALAADQARQKAAADTSKSSLAAAKERMSFIGQVMSGVNDQSSYDQARQVLQSNGVDLSNVPPVYDPVVIARNRAQAIEVEKQIDQRLRQQQFEESRRHNITTEGLTARGQNMTDARARDLNQITKENKPLTDAQSKAALFGSRMKAANEVLQGLSQTGTDTSIPGARSGYGVGALINVLSPASQQQLEQAKRDFVNATLRRESGAVISDSEFANAEKQYFPQIGDSQAVKEQKQRNREIAMRGVLAEVPEGRREGLVSEITGSKTKSGATVSNW